MALSYTDDTWFHSLFCTHKNHTNTKSCMTSEDFESTQVILTIFMVLFPLFYNKTPDYTWSRYAFYLI